MRLLHDFYQWVVGMRRSGTSSLLEKIAKTEDVYILVPTQKEKEDKKWNGKALCFSDLERGAIKPKPILVDNHFMIELASKAIEYQSELERQTLYRNSLLNNIKTQLSAFERTNGNFDGSRTQDIFDIL